MGMIILGAGLSGLIAGALNQNSVILEPFENKPSHKALLRFRTPDIGEAIGIPFKEVTVYKGIWHNDQPVELSPRYIALYSRKVSDTIAYRSIRKLEPEKRWIAPDDLQDRLKEMLPKRIEYNVDLDTINLDATWDPTVSTLPINVLAKILDHEPIETYGSQAIRPIYVSRFIIPDCDVYMTYYYTDPTVHIYRASITGNVLIIESVWPELSDEDYKTVLRSFGLTGWTLNEEIRNFEQKNGKMTPMDEKQRRDFIVWATMKHNVYSLGRFAVWRNLVLDDVYKDILQIKKMINQDHYGRYHESHFN